MDKKRLTQNTMTAYNELTLAKSSVGFDSPVTKADNAYNNLYGVFLCPCTDFALSLGESDRGSLCPPFPLLRSVNLFGSPFLFDSRRGGDNKYLLTKEGYSHV